MKKISKDFYLRDNVVQISKELLGKVLYTKFEHIVTGGIITETEAYCGATDKASHAYGNRRTKRTEVMYHQGGLAYVYLCYGIHSLFNIVTNQQEIPDAVLIRSIKPIEGIDKILERREKTRLDKKTCYGPGTVSQALGIETKHTGMSLTGREIWVEDHGIVVTPSEITSGPRVGVDYAEEDALLPYRFILDI